MGLPVTYRAAFVFGMKDKKVELLSPAGNREGFYGAVCAGADAVYLGGRKFGARAYADNFTEEELTECIRYAHLWGRKVYLTVNTLVKDSEWEELYPYLCPLYEAGLDGVIVQDMGVLLFLREQFPQMELHASTQMTLTGVYGASYLKELGVTRIVPARELSLSEIHGIRERTGLEIETFIHGAMCYCYSGQCLFSSILGGRSGNRGRCAQPCRLPYTVTAANARGREGYPLSMKDMCTVRYLPQLMEAGIDSFKIEGRMKKAEYAAGVTAVYRKYIDRWYDEPRKKQSVDPKDMEILTGLYIRSGVQEGYFEKRNGADMITLDSPAYNGSSEEVLSRIRRRYLEQRPRMSVDLSAKFHPGEAARLTLTWGEISATVLGEPVCAARNRPVSRENIARQLTRLGDTSFQAGEVSIDLDAEIFYPLGALNELRRRAVKELEDLIILSRGFPVSRTCRGPVGNAGCGSPSRVEVPKAAVAEGAVLEGAAPFHVTRRETSSQERAAVSPLTVSVSSIGQLRALTGLLDEDRGRGLRRVYLDSALWEREEEELPALLHALDGKTELFISLPYIIRQKDEPFLQKLLKFSSGSPTAGCMVRSLEGYAYLKAHHFTKKIAADANFYVWNRKTLLYWKDRLDSFCLPFELNGKETGRLLEGTGARPEKVVYGYLPMMITANCAVQTAFGCRHGDGVSWAELTDRYQKRFPTAVCCGRCMNVIYNSVPLSLHTGCAKWQPQTHPRLDFTLETEAQTGQVIRYFGRLLADPSRAEAPPFRDYTTGHEKRGVE